MYKHHAQRIREALDEPELLNERLYDATTWLYDHGYGDADMVRLLLSICAFRDIEALLEILENNEE